jgi:hypothetical protein
MMSLLTELVIFAKRKTTNMPRLRRFAFMATGGEWEACIQAGVEHYPN